MSKPKNVDDGKAVKRSISLTEGMLEAIGERMRALGIRNFSGYFQTIVREDLLRRGPLTHSESQAAVAPAAPAVAHPLTEDQAQALLSPAPAAGKAKRGPAAR
jgi:hypothetical protein